VEQRGLGGILFNHVRQNTSVLDSSHPLSHLHLHPTLVPIRPDFGANAPGFRSSIDLSDATRFWMVGGRVERRGGVIEDTVRGEESGRKREKEGKGDGRGLVMVVSVAGVDAEITGICLGSPGPKPERL